MDGVFVMTSEASANLLSKMKAATTEKSLVGANFAVGTATASSAQAAGAGTISGAVVAPATVPVNLKEPLVFPTDEDVLLEVEKLVCSHGDTVHYAERPQFFDTCEGSYLYDSAETPFLDLQMWYSAV